MKDNKNNNKSRNHTEGKNSSRPNAGKPDKIFKKEDILIGKIEGNSKGFGFLIQENVSEDLFIPAKGMNGAMHGDTVEAVMVSQNRGAGEAEVVKVIERSSSSIVGTYTDNGNFGFVTPDDSHIAKDIYIDKQQTLNAKNNQKVVVEIVSYPQNKKPEGKIVEVLGDINDVGVDILSIIRSYKLYEEFPRKVQKEAIDIGEEVSLDEIAKRADFRNETVITIDGADAKDLDDAVSVSILDNGNFNLQVHIADVSYYVRANSALDKEAFKRGTSVYFPDRVLPMLPRELSNGICSLNPNVDRLVLSAVMEIDNAGKVIKHKIKQGVIKSKERMTYDEVTLILEGDKQLQSKYSQVMPMLFDMEKLSKVLFKKRKDRGTIEFDISESKIELDDFGKVKNITKYPRLIAHRIIEEFMLIANETVAEHMFNLKSPFVYRAHAEPPSEKVENLIKFLSALGISFKGDIEKPQPIDFARLLENLDPKLSAVVNRVALRSMTKASYEPVNTGHFGLAASFYCHFTSPIRRYPDLVIHRIINDYLKNGVKSLEKYEAFTRDAATNSSVRERLAEEAERKVDDLKKAEFMSNKIGEKFSGIISGVTEWGIFVELDNSVEGLIRTENLPGEGYVLNAELMRLDNSDNSFRLGDRLDIIVAGVNVDKISFALNLENN